MPSSDTLQGESCPNPATGATSSRSPCIRDMSASQAQPWALRSPPQSAASSGIHPNDSAWFTWVPPCCLPPLPPLTPVAPPTVLPQPPPHPWQCFGHSADTLVSLSGAAYPVCRPPTLTQALRVSSSKPCWGASMCHPRRSAKATATQASCLSLSLWSTDHAEQRGLSMSPLFPGSPGSGCWAPQMGRQVRGQFPPHLTYQAQKGWLSPPLKWLSSGPGAVA